MSPEATPTRRFPLGRVFQVLLLIAGAAGLLRTEWRRLATDATTVARGSFWKALDEEGAPLEVRRSAGFRLEDGEVVELLVEDDAQVRRVDVAALLQRTGSFIDIEIDTGSGTDVLRIAPADSFGVVLGRKNDLGRFQPRAARQAGVELFKRFEVTLSFSSDAVSVRVDDREPFRAAWEGERIEGVTLHARAGRSLVQGLGVRLDVGGESAELYDDLSHLAEASRVAALLGFAGRALAVISLLLVFLRSLCRSAPPWSVLVRAGLALLVPLALWSTLQLAAPLPQSPAIVAVLLVLGFVPGLFLLREFTAGEVEPRWSPFAALCVSAFLTMAVVAAGRALDKRHAPALAAERAAVGVAEPAPIGERSARLDASNALRVDAPLRSFDLRGRLRLSDGAIAQLRLRAPSIGDAEGVSLYLSADPRFPTGWVEETRGDVRDLDRRQVSIAVEREVALEVLVRGRAFTARVDGEVVASAESRLFPRGSVVALAAAGVVEVAALAIDPVALDESSPTRLPDWARAAGMMTGFFLAFVLLAAWLLGRSLMAVAWPASFALLPLACAVTADDPFTAFAATATAGWLVAVGLVLLVLPVALSRRLSLPGYLVLSGYVVACGVVLFGQLRNRPWPQTEVVLSGITPLDWRGDRLESDLIHIQHPMHRRFHPYLAAHEFRQRRHSLKKDEGTVRVVTLGTSSTYGYAAREPYGHRLERMLRDEGYPVEVIVAAWPGSAGTRQRDFLRNVVLDFDPDILTVSLFYNDSYVLSQIDEPGYLARVTAPGYERGWLDDLRDRVRGGMAERTYRRLLSQGGDVESAVSALSDRPPPVIFEEILRSFAEIAREHDLGLLFIKEPTAGVRPWREAFYEVMDRVAVDSDALIAHPSPEMDRRGGRRLYVDIVHPNDEGHQVMAEVLLPFVRRLVRERLGR